MNIPRLTVRDADAASLLGIYLADHLAGAVAGTELAERTLQNNRGTEYEPFLRELVQDIREDRQTLLRVMRHLGHSESQLKQAGAFVAERVGRLKLNGQLLGYSPLSRLVELEGLATGVEAKHRLWGSLRAALGSDLMPPDVDLDDLLRRAEAQVEKIEEHRRKAAVAAFAEG